MFIVVEVDDPADIGSNEIKRWVANSVEIQGLIPMYMQCILNEVHPATPKDD